MAWTCIQLLLTTLCTLIEIQTCSCWSTFRDFYRYSSLLSSRGSRMIRLIPSAAGVSENPFLAYSFCAGGSAINVRRQLPGGERSSISFTMRLKMISPSPRRWCSGSTTISAMWKYLLFAKSAQYFRHHLGSHPPISYHPPPKARPIPTIVGVSSDADGSV